MKLNYEKHLDGVLYKTINRGENKEGNDTLSPFIFLPLLRVAPEKYFSKVRKSEGKLI